METCDLLDHSGGLAARPESRGGSHQWPFGDSTFYGYFVPPTEDDIIWGIGQGLVAPTHTSDVLGNDKWAVGPALIVGVQPGNWSIF